MFNIDIIYFINARRGGLNNVTQSVLSSRRAPAQREPEFDKLKFPFLPDLPNINFYKEAK